MKLNPIPSVETAIKNIERWKQDIYDTLPILNEIAFALEIVDLPKGTTFHLGTTTTASINCSITGLDSFHDLQEILEALVWAFGPVDYTYDDPGQRRRTYHFERFHFHTYISSDASGCKILEVGEKYTPGRIEMELKFVCEGDPEFEIEEAVA